MQDRESERGKKETEGEKRSTIKINTRMCNLISERRTFDRANNRSLMNLRNFFQLLDPITANVTNRVVALHQCDSMIRASLLGILLAYSCTFMHCTDHYGR